MRKSNTKSNAKTPRKTGAASPTKNGTMSPAKISTEESIDSASVVGELPKKDSKMKKS